MDQFNKALSFILGLVVVAVFIIVASGKINLKGITLPKSQATTGTVTPTVTPIQTPQPTGRPWFAFFGPPAAAPTPLPTALPTPTIIPQTAGLATGGSTQNPNYHSYSATNTPASIPNTGVPIALFPLLGSSLLTGIFLKKTGKKE